MDCEGAEYKLFKDKEFLKYLNPDYIMMEYHEGPELLISILEKLEYDVRCANKQGRVGMIFAQHSNDN
jgi:hypothetical protein